MKKTKLIFILNCLPALSYAGWPLFSLPDKNFLLSHGYIETTQCPLGQGKLRNHVKIPIYLNCKTHCPIEWNWITESDEHCYNLSNNFEIKDTQITHYRDQEGTTLYSIVNIFYGTQNINQNLFKLTFITPEEYWYCIDADTNAHTVTCANDI